MTILEILQRPASTQLVKSLDDDSLLKLHQLCKSNFPVPVLQERRKSEFEPLCRQEILNRQSEIKKSKEGTDILEKGKKMPIGTISNGYKKVAEGKWQKVSEHGMTKREHNSKLEEMRQAGPSLSRNLDSEYKKHADAHESLDDKEYDDAHVKFKSQTHSLVDDMDSIEEMEEMLKERGLKEGKDYELHTARGDDYPYAVTAHSKEAHEVTASYKGDK